MLTTSADFDTAIRNQTLDVRARVRWWYSWNHLLDATVTDAVASSVDTELFPVESVLNERHQEVSGSSYAFTGEASLATDPRYGFRLPPADEQINPIYVTDNKTAGANNATIYSDIQVTYPESVDSNVVEVQLESMKHVSGGMVTNNVTVHTYNGSTWDQIFDGQIPDTDEGRLVLYYNGTSWVTTEQDYTNTTTIQGVRVEIGDTVSTAWNPKVRYVGAHNVVDVSDDIIDFSVTKSENEQLSYMPFGEPTSNTANITLDNTAQQYAFAPANQAQPHWDLDMRMDFELGLDLSRTGGTGVEYLPVGTFYIDNLGYNTDEMTLSISLSDITKFFQRKFIDNMLLADRSLKFIIKDILARTGLDASKADFAFGVASNANETRSLNYVWFTDDQLIWDAFTSLAKSELGTIFITETNNYKFTDYKFLDDQIAAGVQYTIDADVDLEVANQDFSVDANKVSVNWRTVGKNVDERGLVTPTYITTSGGPILGYDTTGAIELSQVLWEPAGTLALNASTLYESIDASQDYIRLERPLADTFPDSGTINVEGEYMTYTGKTVNANYIELTGLTRGARSTTAAAHDDATDDVATMDANVFSYYTYAASGGPNITTGATNGKFEAEQLCDNDPYQTWTAWRPFGTFTNPSASDYAYGTRLIFKDISGGYTKDNIGGMFVHAKPSSWAGDKSIFDTYWIEILSLTELIDNTYATGTVRVYRTTDSYTVDDRTGTPPTQDTVTGEGAVHGFDAAIVDDDIPVNIDVYFDYDEVTPSDSLFSLYINDSFVTSWKAAYSPGEVTHPGMDADDEARLGQANLTGNIGVYLRGNTKAQFEYVYAGTRTKATQDPVLDYVYGGFTGNAADIYGLENFIEFGSIAHEFRSFEVDHQVYPNIWAKTFHSNELEAEIIYESHTPFTSRVDVINTSRSPAILVGNDSSPYNSTLGANHQFFVYGSTIIEIESGDVEVVNGPAIRKRGLSAVEVDNEWIYDHDHAQEIADWIDTNWSEPVDFFTIDWFPNWALQVGDVVEIDYNEKGF